MIVLTIFLALLLTVYVAVCIKLFGISEALSDTYYQGAGKWFTALMLTEAVGISPLLVSPCGGETIPLLLGIVGCLGLVGVGLIPFYLHCRRCHWAHKAAAWVAAVGCVGWCLSVSVWPTAYCAVLMAAYLVATRKRWMLVAELLGFVDVFATLIVYSL